MTRVKFFRAVMAIGFCAALSLSAIVSNAAPDSRRRTTAPPSAAATTTPKPTSASTATATPKPTAAPTATALEVREIGADEMELVEDDVTPTPKPTAKATSKPTATPKPTTTATSKSTAKPTTTKTPTVLTGPYSDEMKIPYPTGITLGGAAKNERKYDVAKSAFYKVPDVFNSKGNKNFTLLPQYKTYQQTTEWSSGPAAALTVLNYIGKLGDRTEMDLAELTGESGSLTTLEGMIKLFEGVDGVKFASTLDSTDVDSFGLDVIQAYLDKGVPVLVEWIDWDGHWQVVIGYHTLGTSARSDDVLIVMDPYDTTDHCQDGYGIVPAERFLFMWKDDSNFANGNGKKVFVAAWAAK